MAIFGRLDVLYPDGHRESHQLAGTLATVGSATGNSVRLNDDAIAAQHFRIEFKNDNLSLTDLGAESGTYVSGKRLKAHEPQIMRAVERIGVGALQLTLYQRSDSPTVAMPALGEQTRPAIAGFRASLEYGEYTVFPASSVNVSLEVSNLSQREAAFRIETSGLPDDWIRPAGLAFQLPAFENTQLQFQIKPPRRADMAPGDYPLALTITRLGDREEIRQLVAIVKLGGFSGLSLALLPTDCREDEPFNIFLLNQGNQPLELALTVRAAQARLATKLVDELVALPAGERRRISGRVKARRRALIGRSLEMPFAIVARSKDPSAYVVAVPARVVVQPHWSYRAAMIAAVAVMALLLAAAAVLVQPPEPEISSFELSHVQVAQGTPVQLHWDAANAQQYVIEVDRARVAALPGDAETFTLETMHYVDPIDIALIALQDEITVAEARPLEIYEPVIIASFEANKTAMLRRVSDTLIVRWRVTGAVSLDITSPLMFEAIRESASLAAQGEIELRGAPDEDFEIKLTAEDEIGTVVERTITISVREPECLPLYDTLLYAGPDERFAQLRVAVENVPVLVRGRVEDGAWLHVELASGRTGWGIRSNFECRDFDTDALAVIEDAPQLPTATASPTPTTAPTARSTFSPTRTTTAVSATAIDS